MSRSASAALPSFHSRARERGVELRGRVGLPRKVRQRALIHLLARAKSCWARITGRGRADCEPRARAVASPPFSICARHSRCQICSSVSFGFTARRPRIAPPHRQIDPRGRARPRCQRPRLEAGCAAITLSYRSIDSDTRLAAKAAMPSRTSEALDALGVGAATIPAANSGMKIDRRRKRATVLAGRKQSTQASSVHESKSRITERSRNEVDPRSCRRDPMTTTQRPSRARRARWVPVCNTRRMCAWRPGCRLQLGGLRHGGQVKHLRLPRLHRRHDDDRRLLDRCSGPQRSLGHATISGRCGGIRVPGVVRRFRVVRDVDHVEGGWLNKGHRAGFGASPVASSSCSSLGMVVDEFVAIPRLMKPSRALRA